MSITWIPHFLLFLSFFLPIHGTDLFPSSVKLFNTWNIITGGIYNPARSRVKSILSEKIFNSTEQPAICFGFINRLSPDESVLSFLAITAHSDCFQNKEPPQVLWSPNRNKPVKDDGTLEFDSQGDLVLRDGDGTLVWSTNTSGKFVVGMKITATGNLLLYDANNMTVWSSFDHATDTWLPGQKLVLGQKLTANTLPSNWTTGVFYLSVTDAGLCAYIDSNPPQRYPKYFTRDRSTSPKNVSRSIRFKTGSLNFTDGKTSSPISANYIPDSGIGFQYMRMDTDGHLRVYQWAPAKESVVDDIFRIDYSNCSYPTVCGSFGICSNGQCTCPVDRGGDPSYFKPYDYRRLNRGCQETTQLSCNSTEVHLIEIADVTYIGFAEVMVNTDIENCKQACLNNCTCKAALFRSYEYVLVGDCSLPSQIFSLMGSSEYNLDYNPTTFLKVQSASIAINPSSPTGRGNNQDKNNARRDAIMFGSIFGTAFVVVLIISMYLYVIRKRIHKEEEAKEYGLSDEVDDHFDESSEMPKRFSSEELKSVTGNFHRKIGRGGFGSVYEGIIGNEIIAVKCLDLGQGQGRKQFLAEVKTIGSIHHVNLVKLVGFCAENSHKLLAYEYMCNGSLDKWIFHEELTLD